MTEEDKPNEGEDFASLFAESEAAEKSRRRVRAGDLVRGRVIALGAQSAFVAIGGKAEAVIDLAEFRNAETGEVGLAVGDEIEATVTDDGSRSGSIVLKRRSAAAATSRASSSRRSRTASPSKAS